MICHAPESMASRLSLVKSDNRTSRPKISLLDREMRDHFGRRLLHVIVIAVADAVAQEYTQNHHSELFAVHIV